MPYTPSLIPPVGNILVSYRAPASRSVRGTKIAKGQELYAIRNLSSGLYFIWSYSSKSYASLIASRIAPTDSQDRAANWRTSVDQLTPTDRTQD